MTRIKMVKPQIARVDIRRVSLPVQFKRTEPFYLSPQYRVWREQVIRRAGNRCEAVELNMRCSKASPAHRMFADHIHEVRDGGAPFDLGNGRCLCSAHHQIKTHAEKRARTERKYRAKIKNGSS